MALQKDVKYKGISIAGAYIYVSQPSISEDKSEISFFVCYSASQNDEPFNREIKQCDYDVSGSDPFAQAYAYLKTLDEFNGATEV